MALQRQSVAEPHGPCCWLSLSVTTLGKEVQSQVSKCIVPKMRLNPEEHVKDNGTGLLRVLVLSSEVVKYQIKLHGDKCNNINLKGES